MDGETILKFVRSRHAEEHGGDFARHERHRAVLLGIKDKLISLEAIGEIDDLIDQTIGMVKTDLEIEDLMALMTAYPNPSDFSTVEIHLGEDLFRSTKNASGQFILLPRDGEGRWEEIQAYIQEKID